MRELRGRNAILTGASGGIGRFIARSLATLGVNLALTSRSRSLLEDLVTEIEAMGGQAVAFVADLRLPDDRERLVADAAKSLGDVDILVNNAGIVRYAHFADQPRPELAELVETNLIAPMDLARLLLPGMLDRKSGHIVTIASLAGKKGIPFEAAYAASKSGPIEWTGALRMELEGSGVGVSVICPVYVRSVGMFAVYGRKAPALAGSIPPERVADAVVRAIRENLQEVIVRPTPTRPLLALNALSPALGSWIIKRMGIPKLQRELVSLSAQRRSARRPDADLPDDRVANR